MATCHKCHSEMHEGTTDMEFLNGGLKITVSNIPAIICDSCSETRIRLAVAKYVNNLVNQIVTFERDMGQKGMANYPRVRTISLAA